MCLGGEGWGRLVDRVGMDVRKALASCIWMLGLVLCYTRLLPHIRLTPGRKWLRQGFLRERLRLRFESKRLEERSKNDRLPWIFGLQRRCRHSLPL